MSRIELDRQLEELRTAVLQMAWLGLAWLGLARQPAVTAD